ncbi:eukaryotic translation initiation factor 3 subunit J [Pavlovales sp. CCMP2436]|nr:eukaryotic translation initiation factor 3 subunit J [Pavlovales sp. CCMP2436]
MADDDDWDADDFAPPVVGAPPAPPEEWSDEEGHEVKKEEVVAAPSEPKAKQAAEQLRPKQIAKQKLADREAKEQEVALKAAKAAQVAKSAVLTGDDRGICDGARGVQDEPGGGMSDKLRLRKLQEDADFENAQEAFGSGMPKKGNNDAPAMDTIDSFVARNAADGEALADKVAQKLLQYENTPWFVGMLKSLVKHSTTNLSTDDAKELATSVQAPYSYNIMHLATSVQVHIEGGGDSI